MLYIEVLAIIYKNHQIHFFSILSNEFEYIEFLGLEQQLPQPFNAETEKSHSNNIVRMRLSLAEQW